MKELTSLTTWLILTAVIPGFFTIGILYLVSYLILGHSVFICIKSDWILMGIFIVIMTVTQMFGMFIEQCYIDYVVPKLKPDSQSKDESTNDRSDTADTGRYKNIYKTLIKIDYNKHTDKHLERICGQFFMSCNIEASLFFGIITSFFCFCYAFECNVSYIFTFIFIIITLVILALINWCHVLKRRWENLTVSLSEYEKMIEKPN